MSQPPLGPNFGEPIRPLGNQPCPVDTTGAMGVELGPGTPYSITEAGIASGLSDQYIGANGTVQRLVGVIEHQDGGSIGLVKAHHFGREQLILTRLSHGELDEKGRPRRAVLVGAITEGKNRFISNADFGLDNNDKSPRLIISEHLDGSVEIVSSDPDTAIRIAHGTESSLDEDVTIQRSSFESAQAEQVRKKFSGRNRVQLHDYLQVPNSRGWAANSKDVLELLETDTATEALGGAVVGWTTKNANDTAAQDRGLSSGIVVSEAPDKAGELKWEHILPADVNIDTIDSEQAALAQERFLATLSDDERTRIGIAVGNVNIDDFLLRPEGLRRIAQVLSDRIDAYVKALTEKGVYNRLEERGRFQEHARINELFYQMKDPKSGSPYTSVRIENFVFPYDVKANKTRNFNDTHLKVASNSKISSRERVLQLALAQLTGTYDSNNSSFEDGEVKWLVMTTGFGERYFMPAYPQHRASADALLYGKVNIDAVT